MAHNRDRITMLMSKFQAKFFNTRNGHRSANIFCEHKFCKTKHVGKFIFFEDKLQKTETRLFLMPLKIRSFLSLKGNDDSLRCARRFCLFRRCSRTRFSLPQVPVQFLNRKLFFPRYFQTTFTFFFKSWNLDIHILNRIKSRTPSSSGNLPEEK